MLSYFRAISIIMQKNLKSTALLKSRKKRVLKLYPVLKWFTLVANQEDAFSQVQLSHLYNERKGVKKDYETAIKWATRAAEQGHAIGQYNLGLLYSIEHVLTSLGFVIRAPYILRNSPIKIINTLFAEYMRNRFVQRHLLRSLK